ncbi:protein of unknown function [Actinokineospora alba]|uniref:DUF1707 domain-containing protein n=1 Tax=Actinokineospora alba TaxID=504798 RepID=A0A1H0WGR7_9PSEU|nr:DUF1707 domain-containing protein [Actinokineospora alba]TDP65285.1 uncharacterized protein DUF1707 [Actinokineospora alba]SDH58858.1 protein of unknown function [Actinokineospora alba]SDP89496.1 protein of unknown function [Actinokineospora alba]
MAHEPQPEMRIGDAEREDGLRALGEHMAAGRLTVDEYGDRSAKVATARTRGELLSLFTDLPDPRPRFHAPPPAFAAPPPMPMPYLPSRPLGLRLSSALVPIAIVAGVFMAFRFGFFPFIVLPIIVAVLVNRSNNDWRRRHLGRGRR